MLSALEMSTHFLNAKMMALVWLETALTRMTLELDVSRKVSHFTKNKYTSYLVLPILPKFPDIWAET